MWLTAHCSSQPLEAVLYAGHTAWAVEKAGLHVICEEIFRPVDLSKTLCPYSVTDLRQGACESTVEQRQRDAILLCKHEMHSRELCQMPQLLLPAARLAQLKSFEPTQPLQTNEMSQKEI